MQVRRAILAVLSSAIFVAAQNAPSATLTKHWRATPVRESILNSTQERMSWEAWQTWSIPALREGYPAEHQSIHVDEVNQPLPTLPRLRREWLTPSDESPKMVSEK